MKRNTVLITGGAGFIGSHLAERILDIGHEAVILDNESTGLSRNIPLGATYIRGDVTNKEDIDLAFSNDIDIVCHIAGQASTINSFTDPKDDLDTNVLGTIQLIQACIQYRISRVLYASSMTVYGHPETLPVSENTQTSPISYYGITKYAAERYLMTTSLRNDLPHDFNVTAFRMFNVYGERQRLDNPYQGVLGIFLGNVLRDEPITIYGDGEQSRDFVYIDDVVKAWILALDNPDSYGEVFNLGVGNPISILKLVDVVLHSLGRNRNTYPINYLPVRPGDQRHMTADIQKSIDKLNWQPTTLLQKGLQRTIEWAKQNLGN